MKNTYIAICAALALLAVSCGQPAVTATDSQGRKFVRVREMKARGDGTSDAELWQLAGKTGTNQPYYLKLMTPAGTDPMFTQAQ